jgi:hypothetical protein
VAEAENVQVSIKWGHLELGHAEALQSALIAKDKVQALKDKMIQHHTASPAKKTDPGPGCHPPLVLGTDGLPGPLASGYLDTHGVFHLTQDLTWKPVGNAEIPDWGQSDEVYTQAQQTDPWPGEEYAGTSVLPSYLTAEDLEQVTAEVHLAGVTPEMIALAFDVPVELIAPQFKPVSTAPDLPVLFQDEPEPDLSGLDKIANQKRLYDEHAGNQP